MRRREVPEESGQASGVQWLRLHGLQPIKAARGNSRSGVRHDALNGGRAKLTTWAIESTSLGTKAKVTPMKTANRTTCNTSERTRQIDWSKADDRALARALVDRSNLAISDAAW